MRNMIRKCKFMTPFNRPTLSKMDLFCLDALIVAYQSAHRRKVVNPGRTAILG